MVGSEALDDGSGRVGDIVLPAVLAWTRLPWVYLRDAVVEAVHYRRIRVAEGEAIDDRPRGVRIQIGEIEFRRDRLELRSASASVRLTPNESLLLSVLVDHPGIVLTREQLAAAAWGKGFEGRRSEVELYVSRLRRKLQQIRRGSRIIETVRGRGYRFAPPGF